MTQEQIKFYEEDDLRRLRQSASYPCDTESMTYDIYLHRYKLSVDALYSFGIEVDSSATSERGSRLERFIDEVSEDIYGIMERIAPFNYEYNCMLIAQSRSVHFPDRYTARKRFESALLYQAKYKMENVDVRDMCGVDLEANSNMYFKVMRKEGRHISPRSLDILKGLGALYNGVIEQSRLINYKEVM